MLVVIGAPDIASSSGIRQEFADGYLCCEALCWGSWSGISQRIFEFQLSRLGQLKHRDAGEHLFIEPMLKRVVRVLGRLCSRSAGP